jgi:hypothetical protein
MSRGQSLGVALGATNLTWTTSGSNGGQGWSGETGIGQQGVAAESGSLFSTTSTSTLQTTVAGPGTLTFGWYVPSSWEMLSFNVNGVTQLSAGPNLATWQQQTSYVGSGTQTLQWIYSVLGEPWPQAGYVDEVTYTPGATAPIITNAAPPSYDETAPLSQSQVQGLANTFYVAAEGTPPLSYQWQFNNSNISGATSSSYTVTNVQTMNLGTYSVTVTNSVGTNISSPASLAFGDVTAWGYYSFGQTAVPQAATNALAISGGWQHSLALKSDGTILAWGFNSYGQTNIPPALNNVVAVAAGGGDSMALQANGRVLEWGANEFNQTNIPAGLTNVVAIALSTFTPNHSLALKSDGTVIAWGDNLSGEGMSRPILPMPWPWPQESSIV